MAADITEILPKFLFLAGRRGSENEEALKQHEVSLIINGMCKGKLLSASVVTSDGCVGTVNLLPLLVTYTYIDEEPSANHLMNVHSTIHIQ